MPSSALKKLTRDESLRSLPDGRAAVAVTIQYRGEAPKLSRAGRKKWLEQRMVDLYSGKRTQGVQLLTETVSPTAQTIEALCAVEELPGLVDKARLNSDRVDVPRLHQITD